MEDPEIQRRIKTILAGMFDLPPEEFPDKKPFQEMAKYDSMRALEFLAKLETEFGIMIDPDMLPKMLTVESTVEVVRGLLLGK